jgi:hypothetical protein
MLKEGDFRLYVNNMYQSAMNERSHYKQETCTVQEYFDENKFWLKKMFKEDIIVVDIQE